jgi:NAD-dependent deacetylase
MKKLIFFSGAGVSEESGIPTFRDRLGLWDISDPEDVASKRAWKDNREEVLEFHNKMRSKVLESSPNQAHNLIAQPENDYDVLIITQNVDDLHERAGSRKVIHVHGKILESRSTVNPKLVYPCFEDINIGDKCEKNSQLRPNVIWFNEDLNENELKFCIDQVKDCDYLVVIGTSLSVYPANQLINYISDEAELVIIDPNAESFEIRRRNITVIPTIASEGMCILKSKLTTIE